MFILLLHVGYLKINYLKVHGVKISLKNRNVYSHMDKAFGLAKKQKGKMEPQK